MGPKHHLRVYFDNILKRCKRPRYWGPALLLVLCWLIVLTQFNFGQDQSVSELRDSRLKVREVEKLSAPSPHVSKVGRFAAGLGVGPRLEAFIGQEVQKIGRPDPHPEKTLARLQSYARSLKATDFEYLVNLALDKKSNGDKRFLSAYLMTLVQEARVAPYLMRLALEPVDVEKRGKSRIYDQEILIRTQALEGLARAGDAVFARNNMIGYLSRQDNVFLAGQAQRLLGSLRGQGSKAKKNNE